MLPLDAPPGPVFLSSSSAAVVFLSANAVCRPALPCAVWGAGALDLPWQNLLKDNHFVPGAFFYTSSQCEAGV